MGGMCAAMRRQIGRHTLSSVRVGFRVRVRAKVRVRVRVRFRVRVRVRG